MTAGPESVQVRMKLPLGGAPFGPAHALLHKPAMTLPGTIRHIALLFLFAACSSSHGAGDAGPDGGRRDAGGGDAAACGDIHPGVCYGGPCCTDEVVAEIDYTTCTTRCPAGYARADECTPDPAADCAPAWMACDANADCELAPNTCCGVCGVPELPDFDAINGARRDEHREYVCPAPEPCPDCPTAPNPSIDATCGGGLCQGFDVRTMDLSACTMDTDCRLRVTGCCACGGDTSPYSLIAIRTDAEGDYQALVCDDTDCPECEPAYPTDEAEAYCADTGHCAVRILGP